MAAKSLREEVLQSLTKLFPEVFPSGFKVRRQRLFDRFNSKGWGLLVVPATILCFLCGQVFHPSFLQIIDVPQETAFTVVDQRSANLATIFSITLVVIGWLLTNISIKESITFQMLFKHTYLYPIFYFIISIIGCLIIFSLLRHQVVDMGNIVIASTILILIALGLIIFLFVRLITVVDVNFYYSTLEKQVMATAYRITKPEIVRRKSGKIYNLFCEDLKFADGIRFMTDLTSHTAINVYPVTEVQTGDEQDPTEIIFPEIKKSIKDINLYTLEDAFDNVDIKPNSYYRPLSLDLGIAENYHPFYLADQEEVTEEKKKQIRKSFKLGKILPLDKREDYDYLDRLQERFLKDVKEGKKEHIEKALAIYSKLYDLENKIIQEC